MAIVNMNAQWQYQPAENVVPPDMSLVTVPEDDWLLGTSPFGTQGDYVTDYPPLGPWPRAEGLWIRRFIEVDGVNNLLFSGNCEQAFYMFFDGVYVATLNPQNLSRVDVPQWYASIGTDVATAGFHEVAFLCLDDDNITSGATTYISCVIEYLPALITVQPTVPLKENIWWSTDVETFKDGTEERIRIITAPCRSFAYQYPINAERKSEVYNTVWGRLSDEWLIPIWTEAALFGAVTAGSLQISGVSASLGLKDSTIALIWESPDKWQLVGIDRIIGNTVNLINFTREFHRAWIMPVRSAYVSETPKKETNGYNDTWEIQFSTLEDDTLLSPPVPPQYKGDDFYTSEGLLQSGWTTDEFSSPLDIFDSSHGSVKVYETWRQTKITRQHRILCKDRAHKVETLYFLHRRAGRHRPFWQPSFENDLRIRTTADMIEDTLIVVNDKYLNNAQERKHVAIEADDGVWYPREIIGALDLGDGRMQLTFDASIGIAMNRVKRVSWLGLHRLANDDVTFDHGSGGVCETTLPLLEVET